MINSFWMNLLVDEVHMLKELLKRLKIEIYDDILKMLASFHRELKIQFKRMRGEKPFNSDQVKKRKARDYSDQKFLKLILTFNLLKSTSEQERQSKRRMDDRCVLPKFEIVIIFVIYQRTNFSTTGVPVFGTNRW